MGTVYPDSEMLQDAYRNFNMINFGCTFEGDDCCSFLEQGKAAKGPAPINSKAFCRSKFNQYVSMLQDHAKVGPAPTTDAEKLKEDSEIKKLRGSFKKKHGTMFYKMNDFELIESQLPNSADTKLIIKRHGKTVLKEEDVFEAIRDCHESLGHKKSAQTYNE